MFIYGGKERSLTLRKNVIRVTFLLQLSLTNILQYKCNIRLFYLHQ